MAPEKLKRIFILSIVGISLFSCKTEELILHGDLRGLVTNAETSEPIEAATIRLIPSNDTTSTGNDGNYLLENITPGDYEIEASKLAYGVSSKNVKVVAATVKTTDFELIGIPIPGISTTYLDFGLDLTSLSFTISNTGNHKLSYIINTSQDDWITVYPLSGDVTNETDTIRVTINKTDLSDSIAYKEKIEITSTGGPEPLQNIIDIYLNGVLDIRDFKYYKIVRIGTQTWMAENLNAGEEISIVTGTPLNNDKIEKFCYRMEISNCNIYGGLYSWRELMDYNLSDSGTIGTTQGICPNEWHVPTEKEWLTLINYLGTGGGGKLKESGTDHWMSPNNGATNETGFTALPGGYLEDRNVSDGLIYSYDMNSLGTFWTATKPDNIDTNRAYHLELNFNNSQAIIISKQSQYAHSLRCIKDP